MTPYTRAWRNIGLGLALTLGTLVAVGLLVPLVGDWVFLAAFLGLMPLSIWLNKRVKCPVCGTSPYVFGWGLMWTKPWPNARCAKCGHDLRS